MLSSLDKVMNALLTVTDEVYHYKAPEESTRYVVWAEEMEVAALNADNYKPGQTIEGSIDLYTKNEDDPWIQNIPDALNAARIGWELNSVQYEDETRFIHYEWVFRVKQSYGDMEVSGA